LENRSKVKTENRALSDQIRALNESLKDQTQKTDDLKKDLKAVKKSLYAYQLMAKIPGGIGDNAHAHTASYYVAS
jgi:DNA gyrase/topoisomerase IV subunit A